jgi:hypothetical protein
VSFSHVECGCLDKILKVKERLLVECMMKKELFVWFVVV